MGQLVEMVASSWMLRLGGSSRCMALSTPPYLGVGAAPQAGKTARRAPRAIPTTHRPISLPPSASVCGPRDPDMRPADKGTPVPRGTLSYLPSGPGGEESRARSPNWREVSRALLVVADDATGALATAALLADCGLAAHVRPGPPPPWPEGLAAVGPGHRGRPPAGRGAAPRGRGRREFPAHVPRADPPAPPGPVTPLLGAARRGPGRSGRAPPGPSGPGGGGHQGARGRQRLRRGHRPGRRRRPRRGGDVGPGGSRAPHGGVRGGLGIPPGPGAVRRRDSRIPGRGPRGRRQRHGPHASPDRGAGGPRGHRRGRLRGPKPRRGAPPARGDGHPPGRGRCGGGLRLPARPRGPARPGAGAGAGVRALRLRGRLAPRPLHGPRRGGSCGARRGRAPDGRGAPRGRDVGGAAGRGQGRARGAGGGGPLGRLRAPGGMGVLLGIDLGTSGVRAVVVAPDGTLLATGRASYAISSPRPGWAEQDPEEWWRAACGAVREAVGGSGISPREIRAVGLSGQMHGLVTVDRAGRPVRPAIIWPDQRTVEECRDIAERVGEERLYRTAGLPPATGFFGPSLLWLSRHEPAAYARAARAVLPKDYLRYRLTGEWATDVTDGSGTLLFDVARRSWSLEIVRALGIREDLLPRVIESAAVAGTVSGAAAEAGLLPGTPVACGGGDQMMAAVGSGVISEGVAAVSVGTGGQVFTAIRRIVIDPHRRLHT